MKVLKLLLLKIRDSDYDIDRSVKWIDLEEMLLEIIDEIEANNLQPETFKHQEGA